MSTEGQTRNKEVWRNTRKEHGVVPGRKAVHGFHGLKKALHGGTCGHF